MNMSPLAMSFLEENLCELMTEATETKNYTVLESLCEILMTITKTLYFAHLITNKEYEALNVFAWDIFCHGVNS